MLLVMAWRRRERAHQGRSLPAVGLWAPQPFVAQMVVAMLSLSSWQRLSRCMSRARRRIWQMWAASSKSLMEWFAAGVGWGMEVVGKVAWEAVLPKVRCAVRRKEGAAQAGAGSVMATVPCCHEGAYFQQVCGA
eukprot:5905961-Ditylum_brightwellii.AAC.1